MRLLVKAKSGLKSGSGVRSRAFVSGRSPKAKGIGGRSKSSVTIPKSELHSVQTDLPINRQATVSFPERWLKAEAAHNKNKAKLAAARAEGKKGVGKKRDGYPASWDSNEKLTRQLEQNRAIMRDYQEANKIPFYEAIESGSGQSRVSNDLVSLDAFQKLPSVDIIAEKTSKGYLTDAQLKQEVLSAGGNNIQASIDDDMRFQGLYFQDGSQKKPLPHFAKYDKMIIDPDDTGYYTAYITSYYVNGDPYVENVWIAKDGKQTKLPLQTKAQKAEFEFRAMRFFAGQVVNSSAYRRNMAIQDAITKDLDTALKYRTATGQTKDVKISEQKLAICDIIYQKKAMLEVQTPETTIEFRYEAEDLPEGIKPELTFEYDEKHRPLNSDDLLEIGTDRYGLEPDSVQAILENLYHSGWINYPRADQMKAEDEPIHLKRPFEEFKGTTQEKQILQVIHDSKKENYIKKGTWTLFMGDKLISQQNGVVFGNEPMAYTDEQFDIHVRREGTTPSLLIHKLNDRNISTPATRTAQLAELKQAGIVSLVNKQYVLDKRGVAFKAGYDYHREYSFDAIELNKQIKAANSTEEIQTILQEIKPMPRAETRQIIKVKALDLIEAQDDLAELEDY